MPNVASVLKEEIRRLSRKEAKILTKPLKQALAADRKQMAALRKQFMALSKDRQRAVRVTAKASAPSAGGSVAAPGGWRKDSVRSTRKLLGVTQGQFAKLVGVSPISISFWETGRSTPRAKTQVKVLELRKLSKSELVQRLGGAQPGRSKPGRKPKKGAAKRGRPAGRRTKAGPRKARKAKARAATRKAA